MSEFISNLAVEHPALTIALFAVFMIAVAAIVSEYLDRTRGEPH